MLIIITIEGIKVKARTIPRKQLTSMWKTITSKPLPKVKAFQLQDNDFDHVVQATKCRDDERREIEEWGRILSTRGTDACVYNADEPLDCDYIILIRENPYHRPSKVLEHELSHIARGDL